MATGLLVNQIAYDPRFPATFVFRAPDKAGLAGHAQWAVYTMGTESPLHAGKWQAWGTLWNAHWWRAQCTISQPGHYRVETRDASGRLWSMVFDITDRPYLHRTFEQVALQQFERRSKIPTAPGHGWIDCGAHLSECNSHAVSVIGMCLFLRQRGQDIAPQLQTRLLQQIRHGSAYFTWLAKRAEACGLPAGCFQHEPCANPRTWLLQDSLQAGIALSMAASVFRSIGDTDAADALLPTLRQTAHHLASDPQQLVQASRNSAPAELSDATIDLRYFSHHANAVPEGTAEPHTWMTRELSLLLWFYLELDVLPADDLTRKIAVCADAFCERWYENPTPKAGDPLGWFVPFHGVTQAETAWSHNSVGRDTGAVFPHFVMPLHAAAQRFPDHPHAPRWAQLSLRFLAEYLRPASLANPFALLPNTFLPGKGWLHFAGLWHGMNASYALAAMQAFYFHKHTGEDWLLHFGKAQLDWIAGLNCGLTADSLHGSEMFDCDVPSATALPVSMIHGIGHHYAGSWRTIRGSICNGFSSGKQFRFDVRPQIEEDIPDSFTDEDWITHAGAWIGALAFSNL
jgi:hypothetical protein